MNFKVIWLPRAERQLAEIWLEVEDKLSINDAAVAIDKTLSEDPHSKGESRDNDIRIIVSQPLVALFRVFPQERLVGVSSVWLYPKRPRGN